MEKLLIAQRSHFANNFGSVLRSSAIFYYKKNDHFKTTISFMNYWALKRGLDVTIVASVRDMSGSLAVREELTFNDGQVINYRPPFENFEGSVEVEIFSIKNMVIPYAAIMAIYESSNGISMVHSYGRTYSQHEIEEGRTITIGAESCWSIRDTKSVRSFGVFHNGCKHQPAQKAVLNVRVGNQTAEATIDLPDLAPYSTVKLYPADYIKNLPELLNGRTGNASLRFKLSDSFTRMLVGNETGDDKDFQATHSNFNYSIHQTDVLEGDSSAYMYVPSCGLDRKHILVYPDTHVGQYQMSYSDHKKTFCAGEATLLPVDQGTVEFKRTDGPMPTRIVTAMVCENDAGFLPAECSLGVLNELQPPKRMWWLLCATDSQRRSSLIVHDAPELYGPIPKGTKICIRLFSKKSPEFMERLLDESDLPRLLRGIPIEEIYPEAESFLDGDFGYLTVYSEYVGLTCYSLLKKWTGSLALEHGF